MKEVEDLMIIELNDKSNYEKYSKIRGKQLYLFISKYFYNLNNSKIEYCYVKDLIKYDKRLKNILYIYLGTFEDWLKTLIYEKTNFNNDFEISKELDGSSFRKINAEQHYDLGKLIKIIKNNKLVKEEDINDFNKIRQFRNKVMHHNFLLLQYNEPNEIDSRIDWLKENILILKKYLPNDYQNNFIKIVNDCKKNLNLKIISMEDL